MDRNIKTVIILDMLSKMFNTRIDHFYAFYWNIFKLDLPWLEILINILDFSIIGLFSGGCGSRHGGTWCCATIWRITVFAKKHAIQFILNVVHVGRTLKNLENIVICCLLDSVMRNEHENVT